MATRLLQGVQRVGPDKWQWGRWEIELMRRDPNPRWNWWTAFNTGYYDLPEAEQTYSNFTNYYWLNGSDPRDLLVNLIAIGPEVTP